mmetsp:Transcript_12375/g.18465  ORF Transcript_12375/g.18465 Transcript_12375/m.18465 type:complete len:128 (+) Transcript_12375:3308-3691(+)
MKANTQEHVAKGPDGTTGFRNERLLRYLKRYVKLSNESFDEKVVNLIAEYSMPSAGKPKSPRNSTSNQRKNAFRGKGYRGSSRGSDRGRSRGYRGGSRGRSRGRGRGRRPLYRSRAPRANVQPVPSS